MKQQLANMSEPCIVVSGGKKLNGIVKPDGAKNASLIQIAALALVDDAFVTLTNVPGITDVEDEVEMLREVGMHVKHQGDEVVVSGSLKSFEFSKTYGSKIRASLAFLGSVIPRKGEVILPMPGGDKIGPRPIDIHVDIMNAFGIEVEIKGQMIHAKAEELPLVGQTIYLRFPSVLATVNGILLGVHAKGKTVLHNVAKEPEIVDLTNLLVKMGANIRGVGTDKITIEGVEKLHTTYHEVMPDRLEAGALLMAIVMSGGTGTVEKTIPEHNEPLIDILRQVGATIEVEEDKIIVLDSHIKDGFQAITRPFPGLATDIQPIITPLAFKHMGISKITDTVHPHRFDHANEMKIHLGAEIDKVDNAIYINGQKPLHGGVVTGRDIRSAVSLINTALSIEEEVTIFGVEHLSRGHSKYLDKLRSMGAEITLR